MEVNPLVTSLAGPAAGRAGALLLPNLLNLTSISPQAQALREARQRETQRAADDPQQPPGPIPKGVRGATQQLEQRERRLAPNSRAARRELLGEQQQHAVNEQQAAFKKTLADAAARGRPTASGTPAQDGSSPANNQRGTAPSGGSSTPGQEAGESRAPAERSANAQNITASERAPTNPVQPASPVAAGPAVLAGVSASQPGRNTAVRPVQSVTAVRSISAGSGTPAAGQAHAPQAAGEARGAGPVAGLAVDGREARAERGAVANRPAAPQESSTARNAANLERIVRVVQTQIDGDRSRATLRLDPPELGTVRLKLELQKDVLTLRIETQTTVAHRLLTEQLDSLRQSLQAAGIRLEQVEIRPPAAAGGTDDAHLSQDPDAREAGQEQSTGTHADHSADAGTDFHSADASDGLSGESPLEPAAESLVNILA
jgi:flagellar hook-length control protein FliK